MNEEQKERLSVVGVAGAWAQVCAQYQADDVSEDVEKYFHGVVVIDSAAKVSKSFETCK